MKKRNERNFPVRRSSRLRKSGESFVAGQFQRKNLPFPMWSSSLKMDKKIPRMNNTGDSFLRGSKNDILSFGVAVYNIVSSQFAVFSLDINIIAVTVSWRV